MIFIKKKNFPLVILSIALLLSGGLIFATTASNGNENGDCDRDRDRDGDCECDCSCDGCGDCECYCHGPPDGEGGAGPGPSYCNGNCYGPIGNEDPKLGMFRWQLEWQYQWRWNPKPE